MENQSVTSTNFGKIANATLDDIRPHINISERAYNVCRRNGLHRLEDLLAFYSKESGFINLQNAGRKTAEELENLCQHLVTHGEFTLNEVLPIEEKNRLAWVREIDPSRLSVLQISLLDNFINQEYTSLSVRSQTALSNHLSGKIDYSSLHHFFFEGQLQPTKIKNIGKKSINEIESLVSNLRMKIEEIRFQSDELLESDFFANHLCQAFSLPPKFLEPFLPGIRTHHFKLFLFLQELILSPYFFDKKTSLILRSRSGWLQFDEIEKFGVIGEKIGLSGERVRQIAKKSEESFFEKISLFFKTHEPLLLSHTNNTKWLDLNRDLIQVRKQLADEINHLERTNFSPRFFALVFAALYSKTHVLFGSQFDFFKNLYLIRRELVEVFEVEKCITDIENLTMGRIQEDFILDLDGYLLKFLTNSPDSTLFNRIRNLGIDLLMLEFSDRVRIQLPSELVVCRNSKTLSWEYAYEALEIIGIPAKLDHICQTIVELHPDFDLNPEGMRGVLIKEKSYFISFSRTSTYGLAKWENERKDIRGGTIRDIAEEFLGKFSEPKHCYEITEFVLQYRPGTTMKSVHTNLLYDESGRFKEFSAGFWGLSNRLYQDFTINPISNHTLTYFKKWLNRNSESSPEDAVTHLSEKYDVRPVQIKSWLAEKERSGILRLEKDKIRIIQ